MYFADREYELTFGGHFRIFLHRRDRNGFQGGSERLSLGLGTISYPIRDTFLSEYVFHVFLSLDSHRFEVFFARILRFVFSAAFRTRMQQNTLHSQEHTQNTHRINIVQKRRKVLLAQYTC